VLTGFTAPKVSGSGITSRKNYGRVRKGPAAKDYIRFTCSPSRLPRRFRTPRARLCSTSERRWATEAAGPDRRAGCRGCRSASGRRCQHLRSARRSRGDRTEGRDACRGGGGRPGSGAGGGQRDVESGIFSSPSGLPAWSSRSPTPAGGGPERLRVHTFLPRRPGQVAPDGRHSRRRRLPALGTPRRDGSRRGHGSTRGWGVPIAYTLITAEAAPGARGCEGLLVPPYLTRRAPSVGRTPRARRLLRIDTAPRPRHLARAVLEGVGLRPPRSVRESLRDGRAGPAVRRRGGGARSPLWRQIQADVTGREHVTMQRKGTCVRRGAAAGRRHRRLELGRGACRATIQVTEACPPNRDTRPSTTATIQCDRSLYPPESSVRRRTPSCKISPRRHGGHEKTGRDWNHR